MDNLNCYSYDAESRLIAVAQETSPGSDVCGATTMNYLYGPDGRRVAKLQNGQMVKNFYYDAAGQEIAETDVNGVLQRAEIFAGGRHLATWASNATYFNHADWLGTERARSNSSGTLCETITSLPFGDGQVTTPQNGGCATADPSPNHFTGKERDSESGLDNFGARYNSSIAGRFMSPDPVFVSADRLADPQSLNLYPYARNNPLLITDPTGLDFYQTCTHTKDNEDTCQQVQNGSTKVWVQGTSDDKGNFMANRIANDANGNLVDTAHGNAAVSGSFDENGVHLNGAQGQFIDNSGQTNVNGSGLFSGIQGQFVSDCGGSCQGRAELSGTLGALSMMEGGLNRQGGLTTALDLLSGAHNPGTQWKDSNGYIHVILNGEGTLNAGKTEMHFEGHPTGVDATKLALHMVDTIRDATSGRAAAEKNRVLP
ncbi:MAG TPA: RHS repeat-associated core domain-containing protein [Terriglobia bacterium]|nr:RHS repeat-associated core domain-containing protein [Terriglobia bacterium]